jgi:prepilin-type processing-associated H-X9-DG protein
MNDWAASGRASDPRGGGFTGRRAFTLVELLAVVAIVFILLTMLMPSLRNARASAISAGCKQSLRQLGAAHYKMAMEHEGWFAPFIIYVDDQSREYVPNVPAGDPPENPFPGEERWNRTLFVSSNGIGRFEFYAGCRAATSYVNDRRFADSGILQMYLYAYGGISGQRRYRGSSTARMQIPSATIFLIDAVAWGGLQAVGYGSRDPALFALYGESAAHGTPTRIAYRHADTANAVFYDGHVAGLSPATLNANPRYWELEQKISP